MKKNAIRNGIRLKTSKDKKLTIATLYKKIYEMFPEERKQDKEKIYTTPDHISEKEKFESGIFKLDAQFFYVKVNRNNSLELLDEAKLKQWAKGNF